MEKNKEERLEEEISQSSSEEIRKIKDNVARINTKYILMNDANDSSCSYSVEENKLVVETSLNTKINTRIIVSARKIIFFPFSSLSSNRNVKPPRIKEIFERIMAIV